MLSFFHEVSVFGKQVLIMDYLCWYPGQIKNCKIMYKILLADDHSIVRSGIKLLIKEDIQATIIESFDGHSSLAEIKKQDFDLVLLDINMPNTDTGTLISNILTIRPETKILIFSMNPEETFGKRYLMLGVKGFLSKEATDAEIKIAIKQVLDGKKYISKRLGQILTEEALGNKSENPFDMLSERELEVAKHLIKGASISQMTEILSLHTSSIGTYKSRIFEKLNVKNVIELNELARLYQII
jgi:two-component system, NarL family, invasion response regulator UvrY